MEWQRTRALAADVDRLPEIPAALAEWIARLTPEDLERIRRDANELERIGLLCQEEKP